MLLYLSAGKIFTVSKVKNWKKQTNKKTPKTRHEKNQKYKTKTKQSKQARKKQQKYTAV